MVSTGATKEGILRAFIDGFEMKPEDTLNIPEVNPAGEFAKAILRIQMDWSKGDPKTPYATRSCWRSKLYFFLLAWETHPKASTLPCAQWRNLGAAYAFL